MILMGGDKKKLASVLVAKMKPEGVEVDVNQPMMDSMPAKEAAVKKFVQCMKEENLKGCVAALTDFFHLVDAEPHEEYGEEEHED